MATKEISIHGEKFSVNAPYVEGQALTGAEAKALNQVRAENIANNFRATIKTALDKGEGLDAVRSDFVAYDEKYTFAMGGAPRASVDPVEREAQSIAKTAIKDKIRETKGMSVKDYLAIEGNQDKYDKLLEQVSTQDDVLKVARKRVADKKKTVVSMEESGL